MGGSFASSGNEASVFARFHFRPHFHQHAGFRLVAPIEREQVKNFVTSCTGESNSRRSVWLPAPRDDSVYSVVLAQENEWNATRSAVRALGNRS